MWRFPRVDGRPGRRRATAASVPPARPPQGARREGPVRRPAGRADAVRARLPARPRRGPRLARVRARPGDACRRQLWLDERGTGGDLADLACAASAAKSAGCTRRPSSSSSRSGNCPRRAAVARSATRTRHADLPSRLLIRTAANAYFPQVMSALSLPEQRQRRRARRSMTQWAILGSSTDRADSPFMRRRSPQVGAALAGFSDEDVLGGDRQAQARRSRRAAGQAGRARRAARRSPRATATTSRSTRTSTRAGCRRRSGALAADRRDREPWSSCTGCARCSR